MINPTIVSLDGTGNPAADGCTASYSVLSGDDDYTYYQLDATADGDWTFHHFECTQRTSWNGGAITDPPEDYDFNSTIYPKLPWSSSYLQEGSYEIPYYGVNETTIIRCVAVFEKSAKQSSITVTTSATPAGGGTATPTSETRTGQVGQSETFTLVATAEEGYEFKRWEDGGGALVSKSRAASVTKTYTEEPQTFEYSAIFRELTGLILCNASGTILHGAGGAILRDE